MLKLKKGAVRLMIFCFNMQPMPYLFYAKICLFEGKLKIKIVSAHKAEKPSL